MKTYVFWLICVMTLCSQHAHALTIPWSYTGWYTSNGNNGPDGGLRNFAVGALQLSTTMEHRNYFAFDLGDVGEIASATFRTYLVHPDDAEGPGYISDDPSETWNLAEVSTNVFQLVASEAGLSAFNDLGTGTSYGQAVVTPADLGTFIEVSLNQHAIASMNAASSLWAIGGRLLDIDLDRTELVFAWSHRDLRAELDITLIPTPPALYLLSAALLGIWLSRSGSHTPATGRR